MINLAGAPERMDFQQRQLSRLGLALQRLEASTPGDIDPPRDDRYWRSWERPLSDTEKACFHSHRRAWAMIAAGRVPVLVLEDDAILSRTVPEVLAGLAGLEAVDLVVLEARGRRKLVGRTVRARFGGWSLTDLFQDRCGAAAYVLWPSAAARLVEAARRRCGLADAFLWSVPGLAACQVEPAPAFQADMAGRYGVPSPLEVRTSISNGSSRSLAEKAGPASWPYLLRRGFAQASYLGRRLRHAGDGEWRHIAVAARDFDPVSTSCKAGP
ncbi:glycosyltransferase family 25 protein [Zhengella mangrovi]|nr:glycosyltransferase family 25 protein [Zhengella mangrovi]